MKRVVAGMLAGVLAVSMLAGCSKQLTPEEQAASPAAHGPAERGAAGGTKSPFPPPHRGSP